MPIPKGLIIYTAKRHQEVYPVNIKYRHYSNKISLPPGAPKPIRETTIQHKNQTKLTKVAKITKLVRHLDLTLHLQDPKTTQVMRYFSKLNRIKTCVIEVNRFRRASDSEDFVIDLLKRAFRTMKDLQQVSLKRLEPLRRDYGTFKNLLLQRSLKKLAVTHLYSTQNVNDLAPFTKFCQVANRRKCWPHLNYFGIDMNSFKGPNARGDSVRDPEINLLKFLQDFKACEFLYKCAHFQLEISNTLSSDLSPEEYAAVDEILKMKLPLTQVSLVHGKHFTSLFQAAQDLKDLQSIGLSSGFLDNLEIDSLKKIPNLQDLSLAVDCHDLDDESAEANFSHFAFEKLQSMTNLRSLSLDFYGDPSSVGDSLCKSLSKLTELTYLSLSFPGDDFGDEEEELCWPWLKQVFQAIGKMKKLKTLFLGFEAFNLEGPSGIFKSLCQALGNLTQLSSFHLEIGYAEFIQDKDMLTLASSLNRLTRMESLTLSLGLWESKFRSSTFVVLMDSIVKNLKILSELILKIDFVDVTKQCYQVIEEGIRQMKYLNKMRLEIGGQVEEGLDLALLNAEVRKKMAGYVSGALHF